MTFDTRVRAVAIATVVGCTILVGGTVALLLSPRLRHAVGVSDSGKTGYQAGQTVDLPPRVYQGTPFTLILFARASCPACNAAKPTLAELIQEVVASERVGIAVVMPGANTGSGAEYVRELGVPASTLVPVILRHLRVRVVPTALFVDDTGEILAVAEGIGDELRAFTRHVLAKVSAS